MSGSPSWAEQVALLQAFAKSDSETRAYAATALADFEAIEILAKGDYVPTGNPAYTNAHRAFLSQALSPEVLQGGLVPWLLESGKVASSPGTAGDVDRLRRDVFDFMRLEATLNTVLSRNFTFGVPTGPAGPTPPVNTGNGLVTRQVVDEFGFDMEALTAEAKTLICRQDQVTGSQRTAELFELHGVEASQDNINRFVQGSAVSESIRVHHAGSGDGGSLLVNSSLDEPIGAVADSTIVPGWDTISGFANIAQFLGTAAIFVAPPGVDDADSASLRITGDFKMVQSIEDAGFTAEVTTPYIVSLRFRTGGSLDGVLSLRMGSQTITIPDLTVPGAGVYNELIFAPGTGLWPANFYEDRMDIEIEMSGNTVGTLEIDHVVFAGFDPVDNSFYHLRTGDVPFKLDDRFDWTDVEGTLAKIQQMYIAAGLGYLPSDTVPTIADPV